MSKPPPQEQFEPEEAARRRDVVVRRMANIPPQPKITRPRKKAKATAARPAARKRGASRAKP